MSIAPRRIYATLLQAYPRAFRDRFRDEMLVAFDDVIRDSGGGSRKALAFAGLMQDGLVSLVRERWTNADFEGKIGIPLALVCCVLIAQSDLHSTDVQGPLFVMLAAAFAFGAAIPTRAWLWGVLFGCAIPASHLVLAVLHQPPAEPIGIAGIVLIIPATIGAYCGVLGRAIASMPVLESREAGQIVTATAAFTGVLIGMADFTLITPVPALLSVSLCAAVLGRFNAKPGLPAICLGAGVPAAIVILMAMHGRPTRHHFVFVDARSILIAISCAGAMWFFQRRSAQSVSQLSQ